MGVGAAGRSDAVRAGCDPAPMSNRQETNARPNARPHAAQQTELLSHKRGHLAGLLCDVAGACVRAAVGEAADVVGLAGVVSGCSRGARRLAETKGFALAVVAVLLSSMLLTAGGVVPLLLHNLVVLAALVLLRRDRTLEAAPLEPPAARDKAKAAGAGAGAGAGGQGGAGPSGGPGPLEAAEGAAR